MRQLLVVLFLLLITCFGMIGYSTSNHSVNDKVIEMEQDQ
ncbi:hypothetical protein SAMN04487943_109153 [Gracilibacillus orientalis]|uniref:Uncharacterized protein n=1 Tax=Gracilibacillus orientalis TaxID=334253 RepID=A0A1I4NU38_9BACI|nr:hypothetical protein SAMN04487943_109153 [Gracilibacillus orientalis]